MNRLVLVGFSKGLQRGKRFFVQSDTNQNQTTWLGVKNLSFSVISQKTKGFLLLFFVEVGRNTIVKLFAKSNIFITMTSTS